MDGPTPITRSPRNHVKMAILSFKLLDGGNGKPRSMGRWVTRLCSKSSTRCLLPKHRNARKPPNCRTGFVSLSKVTTVDVSPITRRRFIAMAEVSIELSVAMWCELNFRPKAPGDTEMSLWESVVSLRPEQTPAEARLLAQAALERGQALAVAGEHAGGDTRPFSHIVHRNAD
eukprot:1194937-Prorocentrum_minimum.AAC.4